MVDKTLLTLFIGALLGLGLAVFLFPFTTNQCMVDYYAYPSDESSVLNLINSADDYIYLEMYVFTNEKLMDALVSAEERGVDVRIILEKEVEINQQAYLVLKTNGVDTRWASTNYRLTHSKLMVIDDRKVFIGSPNFSWSAFNANREFAVVLTCDIDFFKQEFLNDWGISA